MTWGQLLEVRNCGRKTARELLRWIEENLGADHPTKIAESSSKILLTRSIESASDMPLELLLEVSSLPLSTRPRRFLQAHGMRWVGDLVTRSAATLIKAKGCGRKSAAEIQTTLERIGLSLGMKLPFWTSVLPAELAKVNEEALSEIRSRLQRELLGINSLSTAKVEIRSALRSLLLPHKAEVVEVWLGLDTETPLTLQQVGEQFGVTRERIRQIVSRAQEQFSNRGVELHRPAAAIVALEGDGLATISTAKQLLIGAGLMEAGDSVEGLLRVADFLGIETQLKTHTIGDAEVIGGPEALEIGERILRYARSSIRSFGCATVEDVAVESTDDGELDEKLVRSLLESQRDFRWLEEKAGWFWFVGAPQNRLLNRLDKILATAPEVDLASIRSGISRFRRMEGVCPPRRILRAICKQLSDCEVRGDMVYDRRPRLRATELSSTELIMLDVFETHGPVLSYAEARTLCERAGLNANTTVIGLGECAVVRRVVPGVYVLMGATVSPGMIQAASAKMTRGRRKRVHQEHGLADGGSSLWLTYKISGGLLRNGVASIPVAVQRFLFEQSFDLHGVLGRKIGILRVSGTAVHGLARYLRIRGAEEGDYLRVTFDLKAHIARVELNEGAFEEDEAKPLLSLVEAG